MFIENSSCFADKICISFFIPSLLLYSKKSITFKIYNMKLLSFFYNGNEIEFHNSWLGKECIKYNGETMSSKYSMMGKEHKFSVLEDSIWTDYIVEIGFTCYGVGFNIYRNGEPLMESLSWTNNRKRYQAASEFV